MKHMTYIIGEPGVGKSTLVRELTEAFTGEPGYATVHEDPFGHIHYANGVTELGLRRDAFSGTDALGMAVQPEAVRFIGTKDAGQMLLAEGDRLANDKFWTQLERNGWSVHVYLLWGPAIAEHRRLQRGSHQDPTWVTGRRTKALRLAKAWNATRLNAELPVDILVLSLNDPVTEAFHV